MMNTQDNQVFSQIALQTLAIEREGLDGLSELAQSECFIAACELIMKCSGKVAVIGVGKSGHIGRKISATLASVGFPAFFIHATEALHGDLGMLRTNDVALLLSYSGSSEEITNVLPALRDIGLATIAITGNSNSFLAKAVQVHLHIPIAREACPHNLAPTASTTATLVVGDMLAMSLLHKSGNTREDFARSHPAGRLGKRLRLCVVDAMQTTLPLVKSSDSLSRTLLKMTTGGVGIVMVSDDADRIVGVFTDGDLRRAMQSKKHWYNASMHDIVTKDFLYVSPYMRLVAALEAFEKHRISVAPVIELARCKVNDPQVSMSSAFVSLKQSQLPIMRKQLVGVIHMHAILQSGIV